MTDDAHGPSDRIDASNPTVEQMLDYADGYRDARQRIREMCNPHLEKPLEAEEEAALEAIQTRFDEQQQSQVALLEAGEIDNRAYLDRSNFYIAQTMNQFVEVLGKARFLRIFGEAGFEPHNLINKEIFLDGL